MSRAILTILTLSLFIITGCTGYDGLSAEEWADEYYAMEDSLSDYKYALEDANRVIEDLNYMIEDAQGNAWGSYEDMGYALDSMYTRDTVDEP